MKKEVQIAYKIDTSQFDQSVAQMQRKLRDIQSGPEAVKAQQQTSQRLQGMGMGGIMSAPSMETYRRATQQARRELDQLIREQVQGQEKLGRAMEQRLSNVKKLSSEHAAAVGDLKKQEEITKKIKDVESLLHLQRTQHRQQEMALSQSMDARQANSPQGIERLLTAYKRGGIRGLIKSGGRMISQADPATIGAGIMGGVGSIFAAMGTAGAVGSDVYKYLGRAPIETSGALGRATQGTFGKELESVYSGRSVFDLAFLPEKARAAQRAMEANERVKKTNFWDVGSGILQAGGVGMAAGAVGLGVAAGVPTGGVLAVPGAVVGGVLGGLSGVGYGAYSALSDPLSRATLLSPMSKKADENRKALNAQDFAKQYTEALEAEKAENPLKRLASDEYAKNFMRDLQFQRSLGLNYQTFRGAGGYKDKAIEAGFTPEMAMEKSQGILAAGGSTRMARNSVFASQLERGANLTNADQVMGTLSGGLGGSERSQQAVIKILAEGTRVGLNAADMTEENRKFVQATAEIVSKSGAKSDNDLDRVISTFGRFISDPTTQGLQGAKTAYETYQQISTASTGPQGVMRAAGFIRSPILNQLSGVDRASFSNLPDNQLTEDNAVVQDLARRYSISPEVLIRERKGVDEGAVHRLAEGDTLVSRNKAIRKRMGLSGPTSGFMGPISPELRDQMVADSQHMQTIVGLEYPGLQEDPRARESFAEANLMGDTTGAGSALREADVKAGLKKPTGKVEDDTVKGLAESSKMVVENFREFKDQIVKSAEATRQFNTNLKQLVSTMMALPEAERAAFLSKFGSLFGIAPSDVQTQAGKPSE